MDDFIKNLRERSDEAKGKGRIIDGAFLGHAADEIERLRADADRYNWLRTRDLDTINQGGVFAGMTPENVILNEDDLDRAIDAAMNKQ